MRGPLAGLVLPLAPGLPTLVAMPKDPRTAPSEFDPLSGKPLSQADRDTQASRADARRAIAGPYNGWERR